MAAVYHLQQQQQQHHRRSSSLMTSTSINESINNDIASDIHGVEIKLSLGRGGCFFAGECVSCTLRFTNNTNEDKIVLWASLQVYCMRSINDMYINRIAADEVELESGSIIGGRGSMDGSVTLGNVTSPVGSTNTSFSPMQSESGIAVFSRDPSVICCALTLEPGESQSYTCFVQLPLDAAPSYIGTAVKYGYRIAVGCQVMGCASELLRLSFRVFVLSKTDLTSCSMTSLDGSDGAAATSVAAGGKMFSNGHNHDESDASSDESSEFFLLGKRRKNETAKKADKMVSVVTHPPGVDSLAAVGAGGLRGAAAPSEATDAAGIGAGGIPLQEFLYALTSLTMRRGASRSYSITCGEYMVAKFALLKPAFRLGEDIVGTFDFSSATLPCYQLSLILESVETIDPAYLAQNRSPSKSTRVTAHADHHEFCLHTKQLCVMVPIPRAAAPELSTNLITLSWRLRFEFVTADANDFDSDTLPHLVGSIGRNNKNNWMAPMKVATKSLSWSLPLRVYPTSPLSFSMTQMSTSVIAT